MITKECLYSEAQAERTHFGSSTSNSYLRFWLFFCVFFFFILLLLFVQIFFSSHSFGRWFVFGIMCHRWHTILLLFRWKFYFHFIFTTQGRTWFLWFFFPFHLRSYDMWLWLWWWCWWCVVYDTVLANSTLSTTKKQISLVKLCVKRYLRNENVDIDSCVFGCRFVQYIWFTPI